MKKHKIFLLKKLPVIVIFAYLVLGIIPVFALGFPGSTPTGEIAGSNLFTKLTSILSDCGNGNYVQGFSSDGYPICKSKSSFSYSVGISSSNYTPGLYGKFTKYLGKILNDCGNGRYIRGFDSSRNLLCITKSSTTTSPGSSIITNDNINHSFPALTPSGELDGGTYKSNYFDKVFQDCGPNKYLQGYNSVGAICGNIITGICGSANGPLPSVYSYPTSGFCSNGIKVDTDTIGSDYDFNWNCNGDLGGDASCSVKRKVDGVCGIANNVNTYNYPSSSLCSVGSQINIDTIGSDLEFNWNCDGINGGIPASCKAKRIVNGVCGGATSYYTRTPPSSNLCNTVFGSSLVSTNSTSFSWDCYGVNGGTAPTCSSYRIVDGVCGSANNVNTYNYPLSGFCSIGSQVNIDNVGSDLEFNWNCTGINGGSPVSCSAKKKVDGVCGTAYSTYTRTAPSLNLCNVGGSSSVTTNSTSFSWYCYGINLGNNSTCSSYRIVDGGWSDRGDCNASCGGGTQYRYCTNPTKANGGNDCSGSNSQSCNTQSCCTPSRATYTNGDRNIDCSTVCASHSATPTCTAGSTDVSCDRPYDWSGISGCNYSRPGQVYHMGYCNVTYWSATCTCEKVCP